LGYGVEANNYKCEEFTEKEESEWVIPKKLLKLNI